MDNTEIQRALGGLAGGRVNEGYQKYLELLDRLDHFLASVRVRYADQILCREGCTDCCQASLSLWPVEAYHLAQGLKSIPASLIHSLQVQASRVGWSRCPLLLDARCAAYAYRPILCRTHGFPFLSQEEGNSQGPLVSYCERNFQGLRDGERLEGDYILNLDALNSLLAVVNLLFLAQLPGKPPEVVRIPISEVVGKWDLWQSRLGLDG